MVYLFSCVVSVSVSVAVVAVVAAGVVATVVAVVAVVAVVEVVVVVTVAAVVAIAVVTVVAAVVVVAAVSVCVSEKTVVVAYAEEAVSDVVPVVCDDVLSAVVGISEITVSTVVSLFSYSSVVASLCRLSEKCDVSKVNVKEEEKSRSGLSFAQPHKITAVESNAVSMSKIRNFFISVHRKNHYKFIIHSFAIDVKE